MKLYLLVTADKFELPLACCKNLADLAPILRTKQTDRQRICELLTRHVNNDSVAMSYFGKCYVRSVEIYPDIHDISYTLDHDNDYLFTNFKVEEICQILKLAVRTYYRHKNNKQWLLKKAKKILINNSKENLLC